MTLRAGSLVVSHTERKWWAGWVWAQAGYSLDMDEREDLWFVLGWRTGAEQRIEGLEQSNPAPAIAHAVHIRSENVHD